MFSRSLQTFPKAFKTFSNVSRRFQDVSKRSQKFPTRFKSFLEGSKKFPNVSKSVQDVTKGFQRFPRSFLNVSRTFSNVSKKFPVVSKGLQEVSKRFQKLPRGFQTFAEYRQQRLLEASKAVVGQVLAVITRLGAVGGRGWRLCFRGGTGGNGSPQNGRGVLEKGPRDRDHYCLVLRRHFVLFASPLRRPPRRQGLCSHMRAPETPPSLQARPGLGGGLSGCRGCHATVMRHRGHWYLKPSVGGSVDTRSVFQGHR